MIRHHARLLAALCVLHLAPAAYAASPAQGTLSTGNAGLDYSSGPFAVSNASATTSPNAPTCLAPAQPCDDFALTVDLPADYADTHPRDLVQISARWALNNQAAYYLYLLDSSGTIIASSLSANDPNLLAVPARAGQYTVRIVPQTASGETVSTHVALLPDASAAASGVPPRYVAHAGPGALGDNLNGEMNIGYNPRTHRALTLGYIQVLRTTFGEHQDPALPDACDAQWADVSNDLASQNTNDPILFTDADTGRTFVSQLQAGLPGESIFVYTDDDGDHWTQAPLTVDGGVDHQTVGGGPYAAGASAHPAGSYPNAVYYCSQSVVAAFCIRSDDGGATFGAPVVIKSAADCEGFLGGIHGHVRVARDGTVYVPDRQCGGQQTLIASTDSGDHWTRHRVPGTSVGDNDPSVGVASDGTVYFCYQNGDGHIHAAVSHDRGTTWINDRDLGYGVGVVRGVFPEAVAGDPNRAACAFLGTTTEGNYQATDFTGLWYPYVATTYDGGLTWHTVNATPDDPVQGVGGICTAGTTCVSNRNLLDFNEITMDERGRVLFGFDDGCIGNCVTTHQPDQVCIPTGVDGDVCINTTAKSTILRQSGGRTLLAAFDPPREPHAPQAACLAGGRSGNLARLTWKVPDNGGAGISGFRIYRGSSPDTLAPIGRTGWANSFEDASVDPAVGSYVYQVRAVNARGEGVASNAIALADGTLPEAPAAPGLPPNQAPTARFQSSLGPAPYVVAFDASGSYDPDNGDALSYRFDFGDGSSVTQATPRVVHAYAGAGRYPVFVTVTDTRSASASVARDVSARPYAVVDDFARVSAGASGVAIAVLANDVLPAGAVIAHVGVPSQGGSVQVDGAQLRYSPAPGFSGVETLRYTVQAGAVKGTAQVKLRVR